MQSEDIEAVFLYPAATRRSTLTQLPLHPDTTPQCVLEEEKLKQVDSPEQPHEGPQTSLCCLNEILSPPSSCARSNLLFSLK